MRTACMLRGSWSNLQRATLRVGFNCAPPRSPQTFANLRQRFHSVSSGPLSVFPAREVSWQTAFAQVPASSKLKPDFSLAFRTVPLGGSTKYRTSHLHRAAGIRCLSSDKEDYDKVFAWPRTPAIAVKDSKVLNDFDVNPTVILGSEFSSDGLKLREDDTATSNDFATLQRVDEERRHPTPWDKVDPPEPNLGSRDYLAGASADRHLLRANRLGSVLAPLHYRSYSSGTAAPLKSEPELGSEKAPKKILDYSQRAVVTALWCNFLVLSLKTGVWVMTSSHVMLAEAIHSLADLANQGLIAYGLMSSRRAPDALHPYGYSKERFVWSLISAVGIFCLGSGATIIHGVQNLGNAQPLENTYLAALVIAGSMVMEGASLLVAISCVRNGAKAEGMNVRDYLWGGHDPTTVAVMAEDGAAVTGLAVAAAALAAVHYTGNPIWDPIGSIVVGNLLGAVAIFLIQRNRHALLGKSMDEQDMRRVLDILIKDPVVDAIYDCKSEMIGPGAYRFKAEIDFNGVTIVQNYIQRAGRGTWHKEFQDAVSSPEPGHLDRIMAAYGEEVVAALGSEVDRLEREIQRVVPGVRHVDIEAHNPNGPVPREKLYFSYRAQEKLIAT